jgi:glycosyltransferase involved in cell wall biosynthesis
MVVESRASDDPSVVAFEKPMDTLHLVRRGLRQMWIARDFKRHRDSRPSGYELFSDDRSSYGSTLLDQIPACQIINLHWIPGFVDYQAFFTRVPRSTPIVWTLHDLNPLTGGCHYDLGCDRFVARCGACPQLGSNVSSDLSLRIWERKERLFSRVPTSRLHFVASSQWLAHEVRRSPILGRFPITIIPYGLDIEEFSPRPRGIVRDLFGIPQDARVLLFVAEDVDNKRKGFEFLVEAIGLCANRVPNLLLLSVGRNKPEMRTAVPWLHLGTVNNDRFLSMVYSAADLFAICSLQEAFGYTLLEAMACGVPAVGHGVGGILDMVRNGVNGLTVPPTDVKALADAISELLNSASRCAEMGASARRIAVEEYSLELQARRYSELYATLV